MSTPGSPRPKAARLSEIRVTASVSPRISKVISRPSRSSTDSKTASGSPLRVRVIRSCCWRTRLASSDRRALASDSGTGVAAIVMVRSIDPVSLFMDQLLMWVPDAARTAGAEHACWLNMAGRCSRSSYVVPLANHRGYQPCILQRRERPFGRDVGDAMFLAKRLDARQPLGDRPVLDLRAQQRRKLHVQRRRRLMIDFHMITLGPPCTLPHPTGSSRNHMVPAILASRSKPDDSWLGRLREPCRTSSRQPARKSPHITFRTGGPTPLSSLAGMSGAACVACCTPGAHAPVRRSWYAPRTRRIFGLRSDEPRARWPDASLASRRPET